jgi:hypothetical protein
MAMNLRRVSTALILITLMGGTPELPRGETVDAHEFGTFSAVAVARERRYQIDARVRPFLFWIRKVDVGDGRITWRTGPDGAVGYELLVGSDPVRTPRRINRWGYLREESGVSGSVVFGVMSQSNEQSVKDADRNTSRTDGVHSFKALRQVLTKSQAQITVSDVRVQKDLTYADLDALLSAVPAAPATTRTVEMTQWNSPGFLAATASLMEEGRAAAGRAVTGQHVARVYPYNGGLYELQLRSTEYLSQYTQEAQAFGPAIRGRFHVLNRTTGEETPFTLVYGVQGPYSGVPLLISWRPRWWLEIDCVLRNE